MKRLKMPKSWRPTWKVFELALGVWAGTNMLTVWVANLLGVAESGGINVYPYASELGRSLLTFNIVMLIIIVFLFSGIRMNKDYLPPQPHPFATLEFWVSMSSVVVVAFAITLLLSAFQVKLYQGFTSCNVTAVALVILAMISLRGKPSMLGIGFGVGAVLLAGFCTIFP
jgi:magnesium-transporting ATPase (P-type)